jgi:hypothetical protein
MCSPRWVVELGTRQYEAGLRQPVPTQPTSKTVDRPPGAAPRPPPSPVTWPPTRDGGPCRPNGVFAGASTAISATSRPWYSCTPSTSRPKHLRSSIARMDPATSAASGTEDQSCNGDTNPCIAQVTGQYEHGDVDEEYRREPGRRSQRFWLWPRTTCASPH